MSHEIILPASKCFRPSYYFKSVHFRQQRLHSLFVHLQNPLWSFNSVRRTVFRSKMLRQNHCNFFGDILSKIHSVGREVKREAIWALNFVLFPDPTLCCWIQVFCFVFFVKGMTMNTCYSGTEILPKGLQLLQRESFPIFNLRRKFYEKILLIAKILNWLD